MNISIKKIQYEKKEVKIALLIVFAFFIISIGFWILSKPGKKYNFRFESAKDGRICIENRYLPRKSYPNDVLQYVSEIVLGPETERFKLLFSPETKILSSFIRDNVLYINLSEEVLYRTGSCSEIKTGIELFKTNVQNSFSKINSIEMYIDNKSIYTQGYENELIN